MHKIGDLLRRPLSGIVFIYFVIDLIWRLIFLYIAENVTSDTETSLFENFIRLSTWSEVLTFSTLMLQLFCHWLVFFFKQNKL